MACANEGETCTFTGMKQVRFGANGQWRTLTATGSSPCNAATFGDPLPNVTKRCELRDAPSLSSVRRAQLVEQFLCVIYVLQQK
jgi:hypothetical protein